MAHLLLQLGRWYIFNEERYVAIPTSCYIFNVFILAEYKVGSKVTNLQQAIWIILHSDVMWRVGWTLWSPRLTLVSETDCIRHLPGSWPVSLTILGTFTRSLQLRCHGNFHALDGSRWLIPHRCLVVRVCRIMVVSLVR